MLLYGLPLTRRACPSCLCCSQIGFITNIVQPMLKEMAELVPHTAALALADCAANVQYYQAQQ